MKGRRNCVKYARMALVVLMLCASVQAVTITTGTTSDFDSLSDVLVRTGTSGQFTYSQNTTDSLAQTFTIGAQAVNVTSINLTYRFNTGAAQNGNNSPLTMHVFDVADPIAGTVSVPGTTLLTETFEAPYVGSSTSLLTVTLDSPLALTANTSYAVFIDVTDPNAANYFQWRRSSSDVGFDGALYDDGTIKSAGGARDASLVLTGIPAGNIVPVVDAGSDAYILLGGTAVLNATATDEDSGPSALTYSWTATGPGTATFIPSAAVEDPSVSFNAGGMYTLELTVSDGADTNADSLQVAVHDVADDALVAHWDFETATPADSNVLDAVGSNNGAWGNDPNYVDGWITGASPDLAAIFNGGNYIDIIPADSNELNNELQYGLTVACWVRVDDVSKWEGTGVKIIDKDVWGLTASTSSPGSVKLNLAGQSGSGINGVTPVDDGFWHHVAGVYDGETMSVYIDGILDASGNTWNFLPVTTSNLTIGARNEFTYPIDGVALDDVRVYNYGLDAAGVAALAAMGDNLAPRVTVTASATETILPANMISLTGTALDPDGDLMDYSWSSSGPAAVTFSAPTALITDATFTKKGIYVLTLTVDDGMAVINEDVTIAVYPAGYDGELAYMPYDNGDPNDAGFWGYQATVYGNPTFSTSPITGTGAIEFDGVDDYLEYDASLASDVTDMTFCAWVRADVASDMAIAGNYPNYDGEEQGWYLWFEGDGYFKLWMGEKFNINVTFNISSATWTVGEWVHVAFTFDYIEGSVNNVKFYLNAIPYLDANTSYQVAPNPTIPLAVGARPVTQANPLDGAIDDLYLYGRVLTQAEIAARAGIENLPPVVDAGTIAKIVLPNDSTSLSGTVTDSDPVTLAWSVVEGPAGLTFTPDNAASTTVTGTTVGDYLVRLTATDSFGEIVSDDTVVKVRPVGFDGLEAHITFEDADPNTALTSIVGMGYAGTPVNDPNVGTAQSPDAMIGTGALVLNGVDQHIDYSRYLGAENQITVMLWAKPDTSGLGNNQHVIQKWASDDSQVGWMTRIRNANNWSALIGSGFNANGDYTQGPTAAVVVGDTWVHLAFTFDGTKTDLYQDGVLVNTGPIDEAGYTPADIVTPMVLGYRSNDGSSYYKGLIDEVRIYDYALSQAEIVSQILADGGSLPATCISRALGADFDDDCYVDVDDLAYMANNWLTADGTADIAPDPTDDNVNLEDLSVLSQQWLECVNPSDNDCL